MCKKNCIEVAAVSVSGRELEKSDIKILTAQIPETAVSSESRWNEGVFASDDDPLEDVLSIISNGSFPGPAARNKLTDGQRRQLRDAMIFAAHVREERDIFVTNDSRAFLKESRKEKLEKKYNTRIMIRTEFISYLSNPPRQNHHD